jgi:hypothetical protein
MDEFIIVIPHEEEKISCIRAIKVLVETGSHYLTNARFGCHDGDHRGWITVEADSKEEARMIIPPTYRGVAVITKVNRFSLAELDALLEQHD